MINVTKVKSNGEFIKWKYGTGRREIRRLVRKIETGTFFTVQLESTNLYIISHLRQIFRFLNI